MKRNRSGALNISIVRAITGEKPSISKILHQDVELLKVALLYGDHIDLISPTIHSWNYLREFGNPDRVSTETKRNLLQAVLDKAEMLEQKLIESGDYTKVFGTTDPDEGRWALQRFFDVTREALEEDSGKSGTEARSGSDDLLKTIWPLFGYAYLGAKYPEVVTVGSLLKEQTISFHDSFDVRTAPPASANAWKPTYELDPDLQFPADWSAKRQAETLEAISGFFENNLSALYRWVDFVTSSPKIFPMLDDLAGTITGQLQRDSIPAAYVRTQAPRLAGRIFARLQNFDKATLDEIIDIRKELEEHIERFQVAIASMSTSLVDVSDKDYEKEVEKLWWDKVRPELIEIDEQVHDNKYLGELCAAVASNPRNLINAASVAASGVCLAIAHDAPGLLTGALAGTMTANASLVSKSIYEKRRGSHAIKRHGLFFLYSLEGELKTRETR